MISPALHSRRRFLQTFGFSAAALLTGRLDLRAASQAARDAEHLFLLGDWGALEQAVEPQRQVAAAMSTYAGAQGIQPAALLLLGDNYYGDLDGGVHCPRWEAQFEKMYPATRFPGPCYAILGNHDYNVEPEAKCQSQLDYAAAHPGTRWTLPAKWYRFEFPRENPLVTFLMLDSNYQKLTPATAKTPEKRSLLPAEREAQGRWLRAELAKPRTAKYLVVCGHHPLYSNSGDGKQLIGEWDGLLREHGAHLYFCGHIHDLEHLEFAGHPTSFVVTGGGGTTVGEHPENKSSAARQFAAGVHGFTHLEISPERLIVRHLGADARQLHAFGKTPEGKVELL